MAAIEPKTLLDPTSEPIVSPFDNYEYLKLPEVAKEGLRELWADECSNKRKKELRAWDKKVRLAITLGQAAVPNPPMNAEERKERMTAKPVAVRQGGSGWGAGNRPVGTRQGSAPQAQGWAAVAPAVQPKQPKEKKENEKKEKPPPPPREKKDIEMLPAPELDSFKNNKYDDTAKALQKITKKVRQVEEIIKRGPVDEGQEERVKNFNITKKEQQYLQSLVNQGITSQ